MSKRFVIWIVVLAVIGAVVILQRLDKQRMESEGKVTFHDKSGDLVTFFTGELQKYGGNPTLPSSVPTMNADWRYAEDSNGFQILLPKSRKDELLQVLTQTLGKPELQQQYPQMAYKEDRFGVGIVADLQSDPMHIIGLRKGAM